MIVAISSVVKYSRAYCVLGEICISLTQEGLVVLTFVPMQLLAKVASEFLRPVTNIKNPQLALLACNNECKKPQRTFFVTY